MIIADFVSESDIPLWDLQHFWSILNRRIVITADILAPNAALFLRIDNLTRSLMQSLPLLPRERLPSPRRPGRIIIWYLSLDSAGRTSRLKRLHSIPILVWIVCHIPLELTPLLLNSLLPLAPFSRQGRLRFLHHRILRAKRISERLRDRRILGHDWLRDMLAQTSVLSAVLTATVKRLQGSALEHALI